MGIPRQVQPTYLRNYQSHHHDACNALANQSLYGHSLDLLPRSMPGDSTEIA